MHIKEIVASLLMITFHEITGKLTLSPANVIKGSSLHLTCQSSIANGSYILYSERNGVPEIYGRGGGSFRDCRNGNIPGFIFKCDIDNWIFQLTITNPVHNQTVYCNRTTGPTDIVQIQSTIFVQVPVRRISLSPSKIVDVVTKTSRLFTCEAFDSRPAANITWYLENITLTENITSKSTSQRELYNVTSILSLTPTRQDQGKNLHCSAKNILEEKAAVSTNATLNILYVPPVSPQLTAVGSIAVNEGQNITLRCTLPTLGNPPVTWSWNCSGDTFSTEGVNNTGTQSVLTLTANQKYNQKTCHCRARTTRQSLSYDQISNKQSITVFCDVTVRQKYKQYELDSSVPVSKSTKSGEKENSGKWTVQDKENLVIVMVSRIVKKTDIKMQGLMEEIIFHAQHCKNLPVDTELDS